MNDPTETRHEVFAMVDLTMAVIEKHAQAFVDQAAERGVQYPSLRVSITGWAPDITVKEVRDFDFDEFGPNAPKRDASKAPPKYPEGEDEPQRQ